MSGKPAKRVGGVLRAGKVAQKHIVGFHNPAEEFLCAQAIDAHTAVKHWVRNIERQPKFSFWLPTSTDYFYPDFVAELNDGRFLVVEYKGANLKTNDDSREKDQIGHQWEKASGVVAYS